MRRLKEMTAMVLGIFAMASAAMADGKHIGTIECTARRSESTGILISTLGVAERGEVTPGWNFGIWNNPEGRQLHVSYFCYATENGLLKRACRTFSAGGPHLLLAKVRGQISAEKIQLATWREDGAGSSVKDLDIILERAAEPRATTFFTKKRRYYGVVRAGKIPLDTIHSLDGVVGEAAPAYPVECLVSGAVNSR